MAANKRPIEEMRTEFDERFAKTEAWVRRVEREADKATKHTMIVMEGTESVEQLFLEHCGDTPTAAAWSRVKAGFADAYCKELIEHQGFPAGDWWEESYTLPPSVRPDMQEALGAVRKFHDAATTHGSILAIYATYNKTKTRVPKSFTLDMHVGHASFTMATAVSILENPMRLAAGMEVRGTDPLPTANGRRFLMYFKKPDSAKGNGKGKGDSKGSKGSNGKS